MQLTWPNQLMNSTLSDALGFVAFCARNGFPGGALTVNTMQTLPGEVTNMVPLDSTGQPTPPIPGWPSGNYRAAFCIKFPTGDPLHEPNVGLCLFYMGNGDTLAQVLA